MPGESGVTDFTDCLEPIRTKVFTILKRFAAKDVGHLPVVTHQQPDCAPSG